MEADHIGLHLAAHACYDPRADKRVFLSMKKHHQQHNNTTSNHHPPPEFISKHPSYDTRLDNFDKWIPNAMNIFQSNTTTNNVSEQWQTIRHQMKIARRQDAITALRREQQQ